MSPRGLSSGRRDKVKKASAKDRCHSTVSVSNRIVHSIYRQLMVGQHEVKHGLYGAGEVIR